MTQSKLIDLDELKAIAVGQVVPRAIDLTVAPQRIDLGPLVGRKVVKLNNHGPDRIFYGYSQADLDNGVGTGLIADAIVFEGVADTIELWARAESGAPRLVVVEYAL